MVKKSGGDDTGEKKDFFARGKERGEFIFLSRFGGRKCLRGRKVIRIQGGGREDFVF